jgi:hypothetical protein
MRAHMWHFPPTSPSPLDCMSEGWSASRGSRQIHEIALVALELGAGWETADDLVIELDDGRIIKVLEGGEYPPPGPPLSPPW